MKLLNLWPHTKDTQGARSPVLRLWQESIAAALVVALLVGSSYAYVFFRAKDSKLVNLELQNLTAQLQKTDAAEDSNSTIKAHELMRAQNSGQLDWLARLPSLVDADAQLTQVVQKDKRLLISGRAQTAAAAEALIARMGQMSAGFSPVVQSLDSKSEGGATVWYFTVQIEVR